MGVLEEPDGVTIACQDVPEMVTGGWGDLAANLDAAGDALALVLGGYPEDCCAIPEPSPAQSRRVVAVPLLCAAKLAMYAANHEAGMSDETLRLALRIRDRELRQMLDPRRNSRLSLVEAALRLLRCNVVGQLFGEDRPHLDSRFCARRLYLVPCMRTLVMMGSRGTPDGIQCDALERKSRKVLCWGRGAIRKIKRQFWKRERCAAKVASSNSDTAE